MGFQMIHTQELREEAKHSAECSMRMKLPSVSLLLLAAALAACAQSSGRSSSLIAPGRIGNAMKFDGAHYVRPSGLGTFEKGTISVWVRPEKNPEQIISILNTDGWQPSACHFQFFDGLAQFSVADAVEIRSAARPGYR